MSDELVILLICAPLILLMFAFAASLCGMILIAGIEEVERVRHRRRMNLLEERFRLEQAVNAQLGVRDAG